MTKSEQYGDDVRENVWKQRGLGPIKVLCNRKTGLCRVVMVKEQSMKIILNHQIDPASHFVSLDNNMIMKSWIFVCILLSAIFQIVNIHQCLCMY